MEVSPHPAGEEHCPEDNRCAGGGGGVLGPGRGCRGPHALTLALPSEQMP